MAYATLADLETRFGAGEVQRLAAPDGQLDGPPDRERVQRILDDASALIDSYVRKRYPVPVNPVPPELRNACCDLSRHDLAQFGQSQPSQAMVEARKSAMAWLERIADGRVELAQAPGMAAAPAGSYARVQDRAPLFEPRRERGIFP